MSEIEEYDNVAEGCVIVERGQTLIDITEAARRLGVGVGTIREWERKGVLVPAARVNKRRKYTNEQIEALIKGRS